MHVSILAKGTATRHGVGIGRQLSARCGQRTEEHPSATCVALWWFSTGLGGVWPRGRVLGPNGGLQGEQAAVQGRPALLRKGTADITYKIVKY